jgi:hypothetical protein
MASTRVPRGLEGAKAAFIAGFAGETRRFDEIAAFGMLGMAALLAHKHAPRREAETRRQFDGRGNRGRWRMIEQWSS